MAVLTHTANRDAMSEAARPEYSGAAAVRTSDSCRWPSPPLAIASRGTPVEFGPEVPDWVEDVDQFGRSLRMQAISRAEVDRWHDALVPVIAPQAPPGVRVRPEDGHVEVMGDLSATFDGRTARR